MSTPLHDFGNRRGGNGSSYVTWREFELVIDPMKTQIAEIHQAVSAGDQREAQAKWLGPRAVTTLKFTVPSAVAAAIGFFARYFIGQ